LFALKLISIGDSVGTTLPREVLVKLGVGEGDVVYLTESPDGWKLTRDNEELEAQMKAGREIMEEHRGVLRELAKR